MQTRTLLPLVVAALGGCSSSSDTAAPKREPAEAPVQLAGVWPDRFDCGSIATTEQLTALLGGATRRIDNPASVPTGIAQPCNYEVLDDGKSTYWTFDFDCRDGMKQRADALFAQYAQQSAALTAQWNQLADAGAIKPTDAGVALTAPGDAHEVPVGAKGLDHNGQGILFLDDDAPCYVRVTGRDAQRRLALAQHIAKQLTFANAPMKPRPLQ